MREEGIMDNRNEIDVKSADIGQGNGEYAVRRSRRANIVAIVVCLLLALLVWVLVMNAEDTERVFKTCLETYGDLDILINNAGIGEQKMIDETDDEWVDLVCQTNLVGPMRNIREALKIFLPKNEGVIINISSVNGTRPFCGAAYTSTKGALNTLTKNVAMRLVNTNIRCNAVAPGSTVTPAHIANKAGEQPGGAKMLEYSQNFVYFPGPECDPMDQAYACLYLASKMGRAVRGQVLQVCNGAFL
jgi:NAD(P)-dependent dehydrogenase (short-subunit alcohol dehydrogenase family)